VNGPLLTLLTASIAALIALGGVACAWPRQRPGLLRAAAAVAALAAVLSLAATWLDDTPALLALPIGPPDAALRLLLDAPAGFFATLLFAAGAAILQVAATRQPADASPAPAPQALATPAPPTRASAPPALAAPPAAAPQAAQPLALAALALAVLAADGAGRGIGLALAAAALFMLQPAGRAAAVQQAVTLLAAAALIAAAAAPRSAWLWAALLGPGALLGLVPLHAWFAPAQRTAAAAWLSGAVMPVAVAALLRLLFAPAGPAAPGWWSLPFILLGAASVLAGGLAATTAASLDDALAGGTIRQTGLIAIGLGLALAAHAADLPGVTGLALAAVLLLTALQALGGTLQSLAGGILQAAGGTRQLDRLGGLIHRMPVTTACLLAGLFAAAAVPTAAGFAALWLLLQAILALPRAGGPAFQLLLCLLAGVLGLAAALAAASLLRLVGMACLGRPRTPRAAVADEPSRAVRRPLMALAGAALALGVLVGPFLHWLADPVLRRLSGAGLGARASWLGIATGAESPGYAALPLASLLVLAVGIVLWLRRRAPRPSPVLQGPAWEDGFAAAPNWLPFGNPATQTAGSGFIPVALRGARLTPPWRRWLQPIRALAKRAPAPAVALAATAALLALAIWAGRP
jgi:formate hydrogenlyase subunit 3/multisubunit Na+/H+ antiporter MnhD subunit